MRNLAKFRKSRALAIFVALTLGSSVAVAEANFRDAEAQQVLTSSSGKALAMCGPGDEPLSISATDPHDFSSGYETAAQAAQAFVDETKRYASPRNPAIAEASERERRHLERYFESDAFAPAKNLTIGEEITSGEISVFTRIGANGWADVRIEVVEAEVGFGVTLSFVCSSAIADQKIHDAELALLREGFQALHNGNSGIEEEK